MTRFYMTTNKIAIVLWFIVFNAFFQQYFSYIVAVNFIGGEYQSTEFFLWSYKKVSLHFGLRVGDRIIDSTD
jgi:hypothetical protein